MVRNHRAARRGQDDCTAQCGLEVPGEGLEAGPLRGVGGTRLCDWWITDDAVLLDTAGRYTTQDFNAAVDRAGWEAFLDLLARTRPRQPLNGVIVAIALNEVAQAPAAERTAHARAIRARVRELEGRLGVRMPIYTMFTKADLIAGFAAFFDDLSEAQRAQVWGITFPLAREEAGAVGGFAAEFRLLLERLNARMLARLNGEPDPDRRAQIAMFPAQVASLGPRLAEFLETAFGGSRADPAPLLRGVYLTSGTQEGAPIDRLIGTMSRAFGLDQRRAAPPRPGQGRSYFLGRVLREVMLGEAMLVTRDPAAARRRFAARAAGFAFASLAVLVAGGLVWRAGQAGQRGIDAAAAGLTGYEQTAKSLPLDPVEDADLPAVLPLLTQARTLARGPGVTANADWWRLGLSQDGKLASAARTLYRHALERVLLPRLLWRLEAQLRGGMQKPDFLYEATRVYLMLAGAGPLDQQLVREWMRLDWLGEYPGEEFAPLRDALLQHLEALLAEPLPQIAPDGELVEQARGVFAGVPLAQRAYSRIRPSAAAQRLPPWRPSDALGPAGIGLFVRASGKPLSDGVPGFFTIDGFHKALLPELRGVASAVASETWVLGRRIDVDANGPQMRGLTHDVIALYEADYTREWDAMLADLEVARMLSIPRAAQDLYILSSPVSPMRALLASIARQLRLSALPEAAQGRGRARPGRQHGERRRAARQRLQGRSAGRGRHDAPGPGGR